MPYPSLWITSVGDLRLTKSFDLLSLLRFLNRFFGQLVHDLPSCAARVFLPTCILFEDIIFGYELINICAARVPLPTCTRLETIVFEHELLTPEFLLYVTTCGVRIPLFFRSLRLRRFLLFVRSNKSLVDWVFFYLSFIP